MTVGWPFFWVGVLQFLSAWLFFRRPGQKFWVVAPIWRAEKFLSPAGVALWVGGMCLMLVGIVCVFLRTGL